MFSKCKIVYLIILTQLLLLFMHIISTHIDIYSHGNSIHSILYFTIFTKLSHKLNLMFLHNYHLNGFIILNCVDVP